MRISDRCYLFIYFRSDPDSIRLRPVLGWAAADYVYVLHRLKLMVTHSSEKYSKRNSGSPVIGFGVKLYIIWLILVMIQRILSRWVTTGD